MVVLYYISIINHIVVSIIAILLIFYSFLLLRRLKSKDLAVSMIFLHEKDIKKIFLIIVIGSMLFLIGQIIYSLSLVTDGELILRITALIYSVTLLYFLYALQKMLKGGEENEHI